MKNIQEFDGKVKATGIETDALFYTEKATSGLVIENGVVTDYNGTATEVFIPDFFNGVAVTTIDDSAFYEHTEIKAVRFPKYLAHIGAGAFYGCTGLHDIDLGERIDTIEGSAFVGCTDLFNVILHNDYLPTIEDGAFAIPDTQTCFLTRPINVEDESDWEPVATREGLRITTLYDNTECAKSTLAECDEEGANIVEQYAKKDGTYPSMSVGNATTAGTASTTSFTRGEWTQPASGGNGLVLTAGTYQMYYKDTNTSLNYNIGIVYFDGQTSTIAHGAGALANNNAPIVDIFVAITEDGAVSVYSLSNGTYTALNINNLYYRAIN